MDSMNDDDISAFSEAMKDVKRLYQKKRRVERKKDSAHLRAVVKTSEAKLLEETLGDAYTIDVANLPEYMEGHVEGVNPLTIERLKNGDFSIQKSLDLHGCSKENARELFEEFLKEAILSGIHCVRVIHGRGLKSKEKPVLKERLKSWILKAMNRKWIVAFSSCKMCDGGPGATYILLRKTPRKKRIHILG
jgi:DNA-nicking Smr family endonuclease